MRIYFGAPLFLFLLLMLCFARFENHVGTKAETVAYAMLGVLLAIVAISLFLYDRIPPKFIIPIGVTGGIFDSGSRSLVLVFWPRCIWAPLITHRPPDASFHGRRQRLGSICKSIFRSRNS